MLAQEKNQLKNSSNSAQALSRDLTLVENSIWNTYSNETPKDHSTGAKGWELGISSVKRKEEKENERVDL